MKKIVIQKDEEVEVKINEEGDDELDLMRRPLEIALIPLMKKIMIFRWSMASMWFMAFTMCGGMLDDQPRSK